MLVESEWRRTEHLSYHLRETLPMVDEVRMSLLHYGVSFVTCINCRSCHAVSGKWDNVVSARFLGGTAGVEREKERNVYPLCPLLCERGESPKWENLSQTTVHGINSRVKNVITRNCPNVKINWTEKSRPENKAIDASDRRRRPLRGKARGVHSSTRIFAIAPNILRSPVSISMPANESVYGLRQFVYQVLMFANKCKVNKYVWKSS